MKARTFKIGLLAVALFAGGCIVEPAETDSEESLGSTSEAVRATQTPSDSQQPTTTDNGVPAPDSLADGVRAGKTSIGPGVGEATTADPTKPQPDPWDGVRR